MSERAVRVRVNGQDYERRVEVRRTLVDFLRDDLGFTGTHAGCEHGACGACTVIMNGAAVRSCLLFAVQAHNAEIETVEGLATDDGLHPLQKAFHEYHGLQCGFCTPGILMTMISFLRENPAPTRAAIRTAIAGNLCRCTGYVNIERAVEAAAREMAGPDARAIASV